MVQVEDNTHKKKLIAKEGISEVTVFLLVVRGAAHGAKHMVLT